MRVRVLEISEFQYLNVIHLGDSDLDSSRRRFHRGLVGRERESLPHILSNRRTPVKTKREEHPNRIGHYASCSFMVGLLFYVYTCIYIYILCRSRLLPAAEERGGWAFEEEAVSRRLCARMHVPVLCTRRCLLFRIELISAACHDHKIPSPKGKVGMRSITTILN
jgi:hypothetical protein